MRRDGADREVAYELVGGVHAVAHRGLHLAFVVAQGNLDVDLAFGKGNEKRRLETLVHLAGLVGYEPLLKEA